MPPVLQSSHHSKPRLLSLSQTNSRAPSQAGRSFKLSFSAAHGWFRVSKGLGGGVFPCRHTAAIQQRICPLSYHQACLPPRPSAPAPPTHVTHIQVLLSCPLASHSLTHPRLASIGILTLNPVNHARRCRLAGAASNQSRLLLLSHARASNMCCSSTLSFKTETSPLKSTFSPSRHTHLLCYVIPSRR